MVQLKDARYSLNFLKDSWVLLSLYIILYYLSTLALEESYNV